MSRLRAVQLAALLAAGAIGSVATIVVWGGKSTSGQPAPKQVTTTRILRTTLITNTLTGGTLGYEATNPVVNQIRGTYTAVPMPGTTIEPGESLYRVDNQPIVLMSGATPAWRTFALGMTNGSDVAELESNLIALGYAKGLFAAASDEFSVLTEEAVSRWQIANGYVSSGQVALGEIAFESGPVLVGPENVAPGQTAAPGDLPYQVTTTTRIASVPLSPSLPSVSVGEPVSIVLPTGATTPGRVSAIGPAAPNSSNSQGSSTGQGSSSSSSTSSGSPQSSASSVATVQPDNTGTTGTGSGIAVQVSLASQAASNVLAVPIPALLALSGGGYGLEVIRPSGRRELVGVTTGIFTGSQVQVSGTGIKAGLKVAVAQ
jgi:hypothetical protein